MRTLNRYPGKYEANESQFMASVVHGATMDGADEEVGDVSEIGLWAGLVKGKRFWFIVTEDSQGFVDVTWYDTRNPEDVSECQNDWTRLSDDLDAAYDSTEA